MAEAIEIMQEAQKRPGSSLADFDLNLTKEERDIVRAAAWLHDIGKFITTTITLEDGQVIPFSLSAMALVGSIHAIGHEKPQNFKLACRALVGTMWETIWKHSRLGAQVDWLFAILHHMGVNHWDVKPGFGKRLSKRWMTAEGKYKPKRRVKLLMILILMDRLGRRIPNVRETAWDAIASFESGAHAAQRRINHPQSKPAPTDPVQFLQRLKGKPPEVIQVAFKGKFGRSPAEEELESALDSPSLDLV
jgi:hypothetical protein